MKSEYLRKSSKLDSGIQLRLACRGFTKAHASPRRRCRRRSSSGLAGGVVVLLPGRIRRQVEAGSATARCMLPRPNLRKMLLLSSPLAQAPHLPVAQAWKQPGSCWGPLCHANNPATSRLRHALRHILWSEPSVFGRLHWHRAFASLERSAVILHFPTLPQEEPLLCA